LPLGSINSVCKKLKIKMYDPFIVKTFDYH
jgi:hypothetical protein